MTAKVTIETVSESGDAQRDLNKTAQTVENLGDKGKIAGLSLTDLKSGLEIVAGAAGPVIDALKQTIDAASDLNETTSKSKVVFGEMAGAVEAMGNQAATSMGLSKQEAIAAAATYGNLFVSMGLSSKASADMSMNLVQLASDFASFNNIPVADALEKIRAGLVGESEPLKSLGVNINEAVLKQEALNLKLSDGKEALSAAAKAQAAYSVMLKQSTTAQGDFIRTSDGAANQARILEAQTKNLEASIGKGLLPAYTELLKTMNSAVTLMSKVMSWEEDLTIIVKSHAVEVRKTASSYTAYASEMKRAAEAAGFGMDAQGNLTKVMHGATIVITDQNGKINLLNGYYNDLADTGYLLSKSQTTVTASAEELSTKLADLAQALQNEQGAYIDTGSAAKDYNNTLMLSGQAVDSLLAKYGSLTQAMIFNTLAQGMDKDAAIALGVSMGIITPQIMAARDAVDYLAASTSAAMKQTQAYVGQAEALAAAIAKLQDKSITITTYYNNVGQPSSNLVNPNNINGPGQSGPAPMTESQLQALEAKRRRDAEIAEERRLALQGVK